MSAAGRFLAGSRTGDREKGGHHRRGGKSWVADDRRTAGHGPSGLMDLSKDVCKQPFQQYHHPLDVQSDIPIII